MRLHVRLDSRLRFAVADVSADALAELQGALTYADPAREKLLRLARSRPKLAWMARQKPATIRTWSLEGGEFSVPRGAIGKLRAAAKAHGFGLEIEDRRVVGTGARLVSSIRHRPDLNAKDGGELRWYQREAVDEALRVQNCLLHAPTGSGKTTSAISLAVEAAVPTLVIVWNSGLAAQWERRLQAELGLRADEIGFVRGSHRDLRPITIAMQQTLWRGMNETFVNHWGMVICDEVQRAAARSYLDVIDKFPAKYRIGISADSSRADGKEFLVHDLFGAVAHEVTTERLIEEGTVLDVECRVVPNDFAADWYVMQRSSGAMPDFQRLLDELTADESRNAAIVECVANEVADGHRVLLFSHRVEHCQKLDAMFASRGIKSELMLGGPEWAGRYERAVRGIRSGDVRVACGTIQAIGTGIDIPEVARGLLATPIGANRQLYGQVRGRLCRPGTRDARLYVMWDHRVAGTAAVKNLMRWNRTVFVRGHDGEWCDPKQYLRRIECES